jgi:YtkA-like
VTHEVSPQPPRVGPLTITLRVADVSGKPATGVRINLEGNMSHPGMTPVFADAKETSPGQYSSTTELSMAGDWYFVVHITLPDGRKMEHQFEIKGVIALCLCGELFLSNV